jgi:hypothetical protein
MCISHTEHNLKEICHNIEELDLSSNLFNSWEGVAAVSNQLARLTVLNIRYKVSTTWCIKML